MIFQLPIMGLQNHAEFINARNFKMKTDNRKWLSDFRIILKQFKEFFNERKILNSEIKIFPFQKQN